MSSSFHSAAKYLSSKAAPSNLPNATKLQLYGLYKYVTVSPAPNTSRPSIFDMAGRAKWDAWQAASKQYTSTSEAETKYLEMAKSLGWNDRVPAPEPETEAQKDGAGDDIWDKDDTPRGGGSGMGTAVSTIARPSSDEQSSPGHNIHAAILSNDIATLDSYIQSQPNANLNETDEFGYTPLHLAADRGYLEMIQRLLALGADPTLKDEDEYMALELAEIAGHEKVVELLKKHAQ